MRGGFPGAVGCQHAFAIHDQFKGQSPVPAMIERMDGNQVLARVQKQAHVVIARIAPLVHARDIPAIDEQLLARIDINARIGRFRRVHQMNRFAKEILVGVRSPQIFRLHINHILFNDSPM